MTQVGWFSTVCGRLSVRLMMLGTSDHSECADTADILWPASWAFHFVHNIVITETINIRYFRSLLSI